MHFHGFCMSVECPHHRDWSYDVSIGGETATTQEYTSVIECSACMLLDPNAEAITMYPHNCIHLEAIVDYHVTNLRAKALWEKEWKEEQLQREKDKVWERLERV